MYMSHKILLICIPYAGGNKYAFTGLKSWLPVNIEMLTLELPGRGQRVAEPLLSDIQQMTDDLFEQLLPLTVRDYILYGHSMGGILANLLLHRLAATGRKMPLHFLVTGCTSPATMYLRTKRHHLPDPAFKAEMKTLGGLPDAVLEDEALMEFFLPIIREDMKALELYNYVPQEKYEVPVTVIAGTTEAMDDHMMNSWAEETTIPLQTLRYPGNHFFILDAWDRIAHLLHQEAGRILI